MAVKIILCIGFFVPAALFFADFLLVIKSAGAKIWTLDRGTRYKMKRDKMPPGEIP